MNRLELKIEDEISPLEIVVLGRADGYDHKPVNRNNPKFCFYLDKGENPKEADLISEMAAFEQVLLDAGVTVLKPSYLNNIKQQYTRDIAFTIGDTFVIARMRKESRKLEYDAMDGIVSHIDGSKVIQPPEGVIIEGGDVILYQGKIFVGKSDRTNDAAYEWLKKTFFWREIYQIPLNVSEDPYLNTLHLDCAFQPVGDSYAIIYPKGFVGKPEAIYDHFPEKQRIEITDEEKWRMFPNIFSIAPDHVVSEVGFHRLNLELEKRGIRISTVPYFEMSKCDGLLRCSTMPLYRR